MKLELKHLAPYFPYGLRMKRNGFIGELLCIKSPKENSLVDYFELQVSCSDWWENNVEDLNPYKPILRPLSDLTKEIEHNGEKFVPSRFVSYSSKTCLDLAMRGSVDSIFSMPVYDYNKLLEWHFDVFGLIDKGLSIDINTLK